MSKDQQKPWRYQIRVQGHLDAGWAAWLDGWEISRRADGSTLLTGTVADQSALYGLLRKVRDLGLPLLSLARVDPHLVSAQEQES